MALDRTWYNTLVDDDGSGMTGSVWDKADVDALMDATDAELVRLGARQAWTPTIHIMPGNYHITVNNNTSCYSVVGQTVHFQLVCNPTFGVPADYLIVDYPVPAAAATDGGLGRIVPLASGANEVGFWAGQGGATFLVYRFTYAQYPAGDWALNIQGFYYTS